VDLKRSLDIFLNRRPWHRPIVSRMR